MNKLETALWYQKKGFSVIPAKPDKKPYVSWQKYQRERAGEAQIRTWWTKWPGANIALVCGEISGVMVVDADSDAGVQAVNEFLPESLSLPVCSTPGGGRHFYFKYRPGLSNGVRVITDTDFRTDGGYVLAPPSLNGNGKGYAWLPGLKISKTEPPAMPEMLFDILSQGALASSHEHINDSIPYKGATFEPQQSITNRNKRNISFEQGSRDETLFHVANCLKKGGMVDSNILECLYIFGSQCSPPFPKKEIDTKFLSALKRSENQNKNLTSEVREWITATWGNITATEALQNITNATFEDQKKIRVILGRLVKEGVLERVSNKNGLYRKIENDCKPEEWQDADVRTVNLWLPLELNEMIEIPPGSIILFAGSQDAGKSATMMNIANENQHKWNVHYFSSELNPSAFKMRMSKFPNIVPSQLKINFYQRSQNFQDVIKNGEKDLNIIDYLEIHDSFYKVSEYLSELHHKIGDAICIVALQKDPNALYGRGGSFTQEKPILSVALDHGKATITKFKGEFKGENPRGKEYRFKLISGCVFQKIQGWHKPLRKLKGTPPAVQG